MIQKHLNLSCYILQHPLKVEYSSNSQLLDIIDGNNDVYQFRLPDTENYQVSNQDVQRLRIRQLKRYQALWIILTQMGQLIVYENKNKLVQLDNIEQFEIISVKQSLYILARSNQYFTFNSLSLFIAVLTSNSQKQKKYNLAFQLCKLKEDEKEIQNIHPRGSLHFDEQNYFKIEKLMHSCCLISNKNGQKFMIKIFLDSLKQQNIHTLKYHRLQFDLNKNIKIIGNFKDKLLVNLQNQVYLMDGQKQKITQIHHFQTNYETLEFIIYNNFLIELTFTHFCIFELIKGNIMAKINISKILQQFQQGSMLIFGQQHQKEMRFCLFYDTFKPNITTFFLMDKEKISIFLFNINKLIQRGCVKSIKQNLKQIQNDDEKLHENVMKTLNFRFKKLESLEKYIDQDLKNDNFGNSVRFLYNQQNIFVLNDGFSLFYHTVINNFEKLTRNKAQLLDLEREIAKISYRLITESKYEDHISNGLSILNKIYVAMRKYEPLDNLPKTKETYSKIIESSRIVKLLKQDKKKKLFELAYELTLKVKGFTFLDLLQQKKK